MEPRWSRGGNTFKSNYFFSMRQIIQSFKSGETILEDIPAPQVKKGTVLIQTTRSLVSLGTERMLVEFGKANLLQKARKQPDKVKQVLDKVKTDGLMPTLEAVRNKLDAPLPLGYCNVGTVIAVGEGADEFKVGDRVASNGPHAEIVCVPKNLVAHIPGNVSDEEAAFTVIGSIGLQGIRLCNPSLGETIVVIGLGLIGLMTSQLLMANSCRVIGMDIDEQKVQLAASWGVDAINPAAGIDPVQHVMNTTNGTGADGVIITASAHTNDIIAQAAHISRKRGRIILVGVIGLNISREDFYKKELSFQVSCSYGPGRYDDAYEQKGIDYPLPYVRWTEKRNFEAVLQAISSGKVNVQSLITERIPLADYQKIYGSMSTGHSIASIIVYPEKTNETRLIPIHTNSFSSSKSVIGIIGAGNFTQMTMLPALKSVAAQIKYIASAGGVSGTALAKKYHIANSTTDYKEILNDKEVDLVMITTRHGRHADLVTESLNAGKNVFVEKPLALNEEQLAQIIESYHKPCTLTVGFNRRFSPHTQKVKSLMGNAPMSDIATMNAGFIPSNVWVHDRQTGGGRIIGEACHFIDLITYLTGSKVKAVCMNALGENPGETTDNASLLLKYENGSTGVINYFSNGSKAYAKERIEVYSQNRTAVIDNFRLTSGYGFKGFSKLKTRQDKGHKAQFRLLLECLRNGGDALIPFDEIVNTTKASFAAVESLKRGEWVTME